MKDMHSGYMYTYQTLRIIEHIPHQVGKDKYTGEKSQYNKKF